MREALDKYSTNPKRVNMLSWKGDIISSLDTVESAGKYPGTFYWDFHRANLHQCLLDRAVELGAKVQVNSRVVDVKIEGDRATAVMADGREMEADLVVGADGINSRLREVMLGREDPPTPTGDLAYRLLLSTKDMMNDPELAQFIKNPQVNYWIGPDQHCGMFSPDSLACQRSLPLRFRSKLCSSGWRVVQHGSPGTRRHASRSFNISRQC
jgi:salicylate hydroxylase